MKLICKTNETDIFFTIINEIEHNKNTVLQPPIFCHQQNLCEKLPEIIATIIKKYPTINKKDIILDISSKNITTQRILTSFLEGYFIKK